MSCVLSLLCDSAAHIQRQRELRIELRATTKPYWPFEGERILVAPKLSPNLNSLVSLGDKPPGLKLLLLNARSLSGKTIAIQDLILDEQADLACITKGHGWVRLGMPISLSFVHQGSLFSSKRDLGVGKWSCSDLS